MRRSATITRITLTILIVLAALAQLPGHGRIISCSVLLFSISLFWLAKWVANTQAFARLKSDAWLAIIFCAAVLRVGVVIGIPVLTGR